MRFSSAELRAARPIDQMPAGPASLPAAASPANDVAPELTLEQQPATGSGGGPLALTVAAQPEGWSHLSSFEKMGGAMHILRTKFERPVDVARTANASKELRKDLRPEILRRRCRDILAAIMTIEKRDLACNKVDVRTQGAAPVTAAQIANLQATGRHAELEPLLRSLLARDERNQLAHLTLVDILLQGGPERARDLIGAANSASHAFPVAWRFPAAIVRAHLMAGDKESARQKLAAMRAPSTVNKVLANPRDAALLQAEIEGTPQAVEQALLQFPHASEYRDESYALARLFASLGDADNFLCWMEKASQATHAHSGQSCGRTFMDVALSSDVAKHGDQPPWGPVRQAALNIAQEARDQASM
jgi:hypothetical protein